MGFYAYLRRSFHRWPDERRAILGLGLWWLRWWYLRRLLRSFAGKERIPRDLIVAELVGAFIGLRRYPPAARHAKDIAAKYQELPEIPPRHLDLETKRRRAEAIRTIDIAEPLLPIADVGDYERLRVVVFWRQKAVGSILLEHHGANVNTTWLADAIAAQLAREILDVRTRYGSSFELTRLTAALAGVFGTQRTVDDGAAQTLSKNVSVSIVVATKDRPADLQRCLESLAAQRSERRIEIIVVDNAAAVEREASAARRATADVVRRFPGVILISEQRAGLSYARNRGIAAATGDIVVTTDDDVTCPPNWIERLVAPFGRADVMVVTGNVLPAALDTDAQRLFEAYGGLGRGFSH